MQVETAGPAGPGRFWVRVDGRVLEASVLQSLPRGAFRARVVRPGPPLVLLPLEDAGARTALPPAAAQPHRWAGLVRALYDLLEARPPADSPEAQTLQELLRLPRDPEGLAAALARWVRAAWPRTAEGQDGVPGELWRLAGRLLEGARGERLGDLLEALRDHHLLYQARSRDQVVIPLALPWSGTWLPGELEVEAEPREGPRSGLRIRGLVVRLDLPRLGPVEVCVRWGGPGLWVRIAARPQACQPLRARLGELRRALRDRAGIPVGALHVVGLPRGQEAAGGRILEVKA